jgi:phosphatidylserine/phosphatidylglycerophosphate/cardiolipin synthase-like enzyme
MYARTARIVFLVFCGMSVARSEPPEAYFSGQDHIDQHIIALMDQSHQNMDMALYEFSSRPLEQAVSRAADRGVHVRLVLDPHLAEEKKTVAGLEKIQGLSLRYSGSRRGKQGHMHHKFLIVDGKIMVTGSYNWTPGAEYVNYEDILVEKDAGLVLRYQQEFERLWSVGVDAGQLPQRRSASGRKPKTSKHPKKKRSNSKSRKVQTFTASYNF